MDAALSPSPTPASSASELPPTTTSTTPITPAKALEILKQSIPLSTFGFAHFLHHEYHFGVSPSRPICQFYMQGHCPLENDCPDRHPLRATYQNLVCKHWLRGLCKKGDTCEFLHEYNLRKMPECSNFSRNQACMTGDGCLYPHLDPAFRRPSCPHYERGFCPLGPLCANKHLRRPDPCVFYLAGFCPDGGKCERGSHPRFMRADIPPPMTKAALAKSILQIERQRLLQQQQLALQQQQAQVLAQQAQQAHSSLGTTTHPIPTPLAGTPIPTAEVTR